MKYLLRSLRSVGFFRAGWKCRSYKRWRSWCLFSTRLFRSDELSDNRWPRTCGVGCKRLGWFWLHTSCCKFLFFISRDHTTSRRANAGLIPDDLVEVRIPLSVCSPTRGIDLRRRGPRPRPIRVAIIIAIMSHVVVVILPSVAAWNAIESELVCFEIAFHGVKTKYLHAEHLLVPFISATARILFSFSTKTKRWLENSKLKSGNYRA